MFRVNLYTKKSQANFHLSLPVDTILYLWHITKHLPIFLRLWSWSTANIAIYPLLLIVLLWGSILHTIAPTVLSSSFAACNVNKYCYKYRYKCWYLDFTNSNFSCVMFNCGITDISWSLLTITSTLHEQLSKITNKSVHIKTTWLALGR